MNKPGIPNVGDTVKIIKVSPKDSHYESGRALGLIGVVGDVYKESDVKEGWIGFDFIGNKNAACWCIFKVKVKIIKRREKNNDKS